MALKLPCFYLLFILIGLSQAQEEKCLASDSNCHDCIMAGPECAWCNSMDASIRCHTLQGLENAGCPKTDVYSPQGRVQVVKNVTRTNPKFSKTVLLQPQIVLVYLRPGDSQSFFLTATVPTDLPITDLTMETSDVPSGINITMSSMNKGNPLLVQVNVDADQCPSRNQNMAGPWSVYITTHHSLVRVKLDIYLQCDCNCTREEKSPACSSKGTLVCGQCECNSPYIGQQCQTEQNPILYFDYRICSRDAYSPPCSGRGKCIQGFCECDKRISSKELYQGSYCECSNFQCPSISRQHMCSGHGRCECGRCRCDDGWTGPDCLCSTDITKCIATNQQVCNGKGRCDCGQCLCNWTFMGPTCEECQNCTSVCSEYLDCVECRAFGTGKLKDRCDGECSHFSLDKVDTQNDLPKQGENTKHCRMRSSDDCFFSYTYSWTQTERTITVATNKQCAAL